MPAASFQPQTIDLSASFVQLIRTALTSPRVTLDKTGLKSYDANGNLVVAINADGTASFTGLINSEGLILPAGLNPIASTPNETAWNDAAGNTLGDIWTQIPSAGEGELFAEAHNINVPGTLAQLVLSAGLHPSVQIRAQENNVAYILILLDSLGRSNFLQLLATRTLHVCAGSVNSNATINAGFDFTVTHLSLGHYQITPSTQFTNVPVIVTTAAGTTASATNNSVITARAVAAFTVGITDPASSAWVDCGFDFIAIG